MSNLATIVNNILADSGIDDINVIVSTGSYANPAWITSLAWTKITGAPANIVTGTGAAGQVAYWSSASAITGESNLFWDATNDRLGIGTATPAFTLDVNGTGRFSGQLTASTTAGGTSAIFQNTGTQNSNGIELRGGTGGTAVNWKIEKDNTVGNAFQLTPSTTNGGTTYTTPVLTIASTGAATFSSSVTVGSWFNAPNSFGLAGRNAANTAFRNLIILNSGNQIEIGRDSDISQIRMGTASANDALTITSGGDVLVGLTSGGRFSLRDAGGNDTHFGLGGTYDNYITAGSSGVTIFRNSTAERMRITSGGDVGIGTATINHRLQVAPLATFGNAEDGNICISTTPSGGTSTSPTTTGGIIFGDNTVANAYLGRIAVIQDNPSASTASHMRFYTNSGGGNGATTERLRITAAGRVLIGTPPPAESTFALDVNGTGRFSGSLTTGADLTLSAANPFIYGGTAAGSVGLSNIGGQTYVRVFGSSHATVPNTTQFVNAGSTSLNLASTGAATFSGRVGVAGAAATYPITVYNASNGTTAAFGGTARGIRIDNDGTFSSGRSTIFGVDSSFYGSYQPMSIEASSLALQAVTGGNVLIGTTTDGGVNRVLSVERSQSGVSSVAMINPNTGNAASAQFIISANNSSGFYGAFSSTHATANWAGRSVFGTNALGGGITISAHNSGQDIRFLTDSTSNIRMIIASNGNVLIGTTDNPGDKLRVNGTTFSNEIMTWNPQNDNRSGIAWRFGEASIASVTPNRRLRVNVGGIEYYIGAMEV